MPIVSVTMSTVWIIALVVFLIVEAVTVGLTSVWFAVGALAAWVCTLFDAKLWLQIVVFLAVTAVALVLTRPLARKYINGKVVHTNADAVVGKECRVTETIDNIAGTGAVYVGGKTWTARSENDDDIIEKGQLVTALRIEGVKLIVSKAMETV